MSLIFFGKVGPSVVADGSEQPLRLGKSSEQVITQLHGRYYEQAVRGSIFSAANQAAQAVSVALATTYTGLLLYNPLGSLVNLVPLKLKYALSVAPAAIAPLGLIGGTQLSAPTGLTALTVRSTQIGNAQAGVGAAYSAATILTPYWIQMLADGFTAAALPNPNGIIDLEGLFIIKPGSFIAVGALTAVTGLGSITWEEVPL